MHIPLDELPVDIQKKVIAYLQADNFTAAKYVRDQYEQCLQTTKQKLTEGVSAKSRRNTVQNSRMTDAG